jgi:antibiotic biosynthesis monooxygenase (ABM) superfamily enzyme
METKMFVRCAFFKGKIKPGMEEAFHAHWREHLVPLWSAFPHLLELRVLCEVESDNAVSPFPLVMAMKFASRDHIAEALESPTRWASKEISKKLFEMFDGDVIHTVFAADQIHPTAL